MWPEGSTGGLGPKDDLSGLPLVLMEVRFPGFAFCPHTKAGTQHFKNTIDPPAGQKNNKTIPPDKVKKAIMGEYSSFQLENGIWCVHRRVRSSVCYLALTIGAGTRDEQPQQHGVAHLVEHLLFKGTNRRTAYQVNHFLESLGGEINAFTSKEETVLSATCLKQHYIKAMDLLLDMAFNSTFKPEELSKEREVIIDEINSYKDSPADLIFDEFEERLFAGSPLGRDILGSKKNLHKIKQQDLLDYTVSNYNTDCMVFSSCCSISHERFEKMCRESLGTLTQNRRQAVRVKPTVQDVFQVTQSRKTYQSHCLIGGYAYSCYDPRRVPLALLINILGGSSSLSRLNMALREKHALTYSVEASYTPYCDSGVYTIYFGCEEQKRTQALEAVTEEINKLKTQTIKATELKRLKKQFIAQLTIASENSESLMLSIAKSLLVFGEFDSTQTIARRIDEITGEQLLEIARDVFEDGNIFGLTYN